MWLRFKWPAALLGGVAAGMIAPPARACEPVSAQLAPEIPLAWRDTVEALVEATAQPGQPWSCPGGALRLEVIDDGAVVRVERPGVEPMARHVRTPDEVGPTGKAMLASLQAAAPPAPAPEPAPAPPPAPPPALQPPLAPPPAPREEAAGPRLLIDATGVIRHQGGVEALSAGAAARVTVPLGRWHPAMWVRYTALVAEIDPQELELSELDVGLSIGVSLLDEPVRLTAGLFGALALIGMEAEGESIGDREQEVELRAVDGRMGTELRLSIPIVSILAAMVALEGEVAPAAIGDSDRRIDPALPPLPVFGLGASVGLEVAIP